MSAHPFRLALLASCLWACGRDVDRAHSGPATASAGEPPACAGEIVVRGEPLLDDLGSVTVSIEPAGGGPAAVSRTWELADPIWRERRGERRLYFRVDGRDAVAGEDAGIELPLGPIELVVRWDPDGNPDTAEATAVETRQRVARGATDVAIGLQLGPRVTTEPGSTDRLARPGPAGAGG